MLVIGVRLFMQHPKFGKLPNEQQVEAFKKSPNYRDGQFRNIHPTPMMTSDDSFAKQLFDFFLKKKPRLLNINLSTLFI